MPCPQHINRCTQAFFVVHQGEIGVYTDRDIAMLRNGVGEDGEGRGGDEAHAESMMLDESPPQSPDMVMEACQDLNVIEYSLKGTHTSASCLEHGGWIQVCVYVLCVCVCTRARTRSLVRAVVYVCDRSTNKSAPQVTWGLPHLRLAYSGCP